MKTLKILALCLAFGRLVVLGQVGLDVDDGAALIVRVKQTPASEFDSKLPHVKFEEWLLYQIGIDATAAWAVRTGEGHGLPWVEADISIDGSPAIVILVDNGKADGKLGAAPRFKSLQLLRKGQSTEWRHLHDLPQAIRSVRGDG